MSDTPASDLAAWTPPDAGPDPRWGSGLTFLGTGPRAAPPAGTVPRVRLPDGAEVATWLPDGRWAPSTDRPPTGAPPSVGGAPYRARDPRDDQQPDRDASTLPGDRSRRPDGARRAVGRRWWSARARGVAGTGLAVPGGMAGARLAVARVGARVVGWPRRVVAAGLLVAAVLVALRPDPPLAAAPPAGPVADVVVAARDLAAGTELAAADLRTVSMPVAVTPAGATGRRAGLIGRRAAGPVRRGEVLTDTRLVGPGLTAGLGPGETAAVPVRLAEPEAAALVRPGDRVDVLGVRVGPDGGPAAGDAVEVAGGVRVLAVVGGRTDGDAVVLVVAASAPVARRLAGAAAQRLTVTVRPP